jgi:RHS repeat-associated protein
MVRGDLVVFGRHTHARKRSLARGAIPATAAALLVGLLPAQSLALPPDPVKEETGREDTLDLETLKREVPIAGDEQEPALESLKVKAPDQLVEVPTGTVTPPSNLQGQVTFGSSASAASFRTAAATAEQADLSQVGTLPVSLGQAPDQPVPTGTWQVTIPDRTAPVSQGVEGSVVVVQGPDTGTVPVSVKLDYSKFELLYGADWATRLRLVQFPDCYLSTPDVEACQAYDELETVNDTATQSLTATVDPGTDSVTTPALAQSPEPQGAGVIQAAYRTSTPVTPIATGGTAVVAAVDSGGSTSAQSSTGNFKATPLASDGKWAAGGSSGAFTWSYPLIVPKPPAGPAPSISFEYNSQSVDGRTAVSSPQVSWIGEGWSYNPGFIERRYRTCQDDRKDQGAGLPNNTAAKDKTNDLCWVSYNAVLSMGGKTTELVRDAPAGSNPEQDTETYRTQLDDGSRVEHRVGGSNGDNNGEYWIITQTDGTKYYYGLDDVGGSHAATNSVSTVPVFGNHSGEPCHATAFADSRCGAGAQQAWRWNLDKVVDVNGNVMIVNWKQETNYYAVRKKFSTPEQYDRAAYPTTIEYGLRSTDLTTPSAMVTFGVKQRCLKSDTACTDTNFDKTDDPGAYRWWWDTPGNLNCKSNSKLCPAFPSFWTQYRLDNVTTKAARAGQTGLGPVDKYTLYQSFPEDWYDSAPALWLNSITRTGYAPGDTTGTLQSKDGISFAPYTVGNHAPKALISRGLLDRQLPNLVPRSRTDQRPGITRPRIGTVSTENGGDIEVEYTGGCTLVPAEDKGERNGTCYPVRWSPDGDDKTPALAWFNKYVVASVTEIDKVTGVAKPVRTRYTYSQAAWAKSDDEFSRPSLRTYSDWRGYRQVTTLKGNKVISKQGDQNSQSYSVTRYFQGVGGEVKDSTGTYTLLADDAPQYAGMAAESLTYRDSLPDADTGKLPLIKRALNYPWSKQTASRPRHNEDGTAAASLLAHRTGVKRTDEIQQTGVDTWRGVRTLTTVDDTYGLPTQVETAVVKPSGTSETLSDQTCTVTSYVHNTSAWLIGLPKEQRTTGTSCAGYATADPATKLKSAMQQSYDLLAHGATPTKGMVTSVAEINGAGTAYSHVTETRYDSLGRVLTVTKPGQGTTETQYVPSTGGPLTETVMINAKGHSVRTTLDPGRGLPLTDTDPNGRITRYEYDALGRLVKGWSPSRSAGGKTPNVMIAYQAAIASPVENRPAAVTVSTLQDDGSYSRTVTLYDGLAREVQQQTKAHGPGRIVVDTTYNDHGLVYEKTNPYLAKGEPEAQLFRPRSLSLIPSLTKYRYDGLERQYRASIYHYGGYKHATYTYYNLTSTYVDPVGSTSPRTLTYFDALGRVTQIKHYNQAASSSDTGRVTAYSYDARGNRSQVKDPAGNIWTYTYDARGRVTSTTDPDTGNTETWYDAADRAIQVKNARGLKTFTEYDDLGRVLNVREGSATAVPAKEFTYDAAPGGKGQPYTSTRHTANGDYADRVTGYDAEYHVTGRETVIPANSMTTGVSGKYSYAYTYTPTGKLQSVTLPAKGGLAEEKVITRYTSDGLPESTSGLTWYTSDVTYSPLGEPLRAVTGSQPSRVWTTNFVDPRTGRLQRTVTDRETANPHRINDSYYSYDTSGLITSQASNFGGVSGTDSWDTQCYTYDTMGELVHAWTSNITPTGLGVGCKASSGTTWGHRTSYADASGPVADAPDQLGDASAPDAALTSSLTAAAPATGTASTGPTAYRQSFTYDWLGNRATMTEPDPADATKNVTFTYGYGELVTGNGTSPSYTDQPHTLRKVTTNPLGKGGGTYDYDDTGNTTERHIGGTTQSLTWNHEGRLDTAGALQTAAGPIKGLGSKCLDVQGGATADGTPIQLYSCNGSTGQQWERTGDVLKSLGKCATVNGTQVQLSTCNNSEAQKFVLRTGDKSLYSPSTGLCLDVPGANSADGTDLQMSACSGTDAQKWTPPGTTTYVYDDAGNRLLEHSASGSVLYLGETELTTDATGKITRATRSYGLPGAPTVIRSTSNGATTGHKLNAMIADHLGTSSTTVELSGTQPITRRAFKPYGDLRGPKPTAWPDKRSYLGVGIDDVASSLTHIGAREYDPMTGRFISADPIIDIADPLQMNGYAYANNSPISNSDPTGLMNNADLGGAAPCTKPGGCVRDAPPTPDGDWQTEGLHKVDNNGDGYIAVFPTVMVPANWSKAPKYINAFYTDLGHQCQTYGIESCTDLSVADHSNRVNHAKGAGCLAVDRNCPEGLGWGAMAAVNAGLYGAGFDAEGPGLSTGGSQASGKASKRNKSKADDDRPDGPDPDGNIVYRALAENDDPARGLTARDPGNVGVSPLSHVAGKKMTPWISTTKNPSVAFGKYNKGHGVVAIDLRRIPYRYVDISSGPFPSSRRHSAYARKDSEVLVWQNVPARAIVGHWPGG